jgi:hypothetical protein
MSARLSAFYKPLAAGLGSLQFGVTLEGVRMLRLICLTLSIAFSAVLSAAEPVQGLRDLQWLIGDWRGLGEGQPGRSAVERHAELALDGNFVRVDGRSVYPKQESNPKGDIHGEIDLWSYDRARQTIVLRQFDTLGFVGTYTLDKASSSANKWVLLGESLENVPKGWKARYTFTLVSPDEYHEMLELDADGKGFRPYVTNRFLRTGK